METVRQPKKGTSDAETIAAHTAAVRTELKQFLGGTKLIMLRRIEMVAIAPRYLVGSSDRTRTWSETGAPEKEMRDTPPRPQLQKT
jgi:hypothetical protein